MCWKNQSPTNKKLKFQTKIKKCLGSLLCNTRQINCTLFMMAYTQTSTHATGWCNGRSILITVTCNTHTGQYCPVKSSLSSKSENKYSTFGIKFQSSGHSINVPFKRPYIKGLLQFTSLQWCSTKMASYCVSCKTDILLPPCQTYKHR
jgi:hypothetical protein